MKSLRMLFISHGYIFSSKMEDSKEYLTRLLDSYRSLQIWFCGEIAIELVIIKGHALSLFWCRKICRKIIRGKFLIPSPETLKTYIVN